MQSELMLYLYRGDVLLQETSCLAAVLEREIYTPYSTMTAKFFASGADYSGITRLSLYHRGNCVYEGLADSVRRFRRDNRDFVQVTSRSFTSVLVQNEIPGGLHTDMTMAKLMTGFYSFPHVYYEDSPETGYIYVREGTSIWDSIVHFCYKLTGNYPFIYRNTVRMSEPDTVQEIHLTDAQVLEYGTEQDTTKLISHFHMADIAGTEDAYSLENPTASEAGIVRHKYLALDQQYLYSPQQALVFRSLFSQRGCTAKYVTYSGFLREYLCDRVTYGTFLQNAKICRVRMVCNGMGIRTTLWAYQDGFNQE